MKLSRLVAVVSLTGAAILLPAVALASSAGSSAPKASVHNASAAAVPKCSRSQLTAWLGVPGDGTAGSVFYPLEISNVSSHTCTLFGYPGVSALNAKHRQLGSAAVRLPNYPVSTVKITPFGTAHVDLQITDVGNFSAATCRPATATYLKVYAPGDFSAMTFQFSFRACAKTGPKYLHVSPTFINAGIPGHANG